MPCRATPCLLLLLLAFLAPLLPGPEGKGPGSAREESLVLKEGELPLVVEADAYLEALEVRKLKVVPEEAAGPFTVAEMLPSGRAVEAGTVVARLESERFARWSRNAQEALGTATAKVQHLREELESLTTANRLKLERSEHDLARAGRELESFVRYGEEQWLKGRALALQVDAQKQRNREDELAQLEKMYQESQIAGDTKDIVLERTRREVALGRDNLEMARKGEAQMKEFEHPLFKEKLLREVERQRQDLELARAYMGTAERQRGEELAAAGRAARDAQEYLERVTADQARMTIRAPIAGILRHGGIESGDKVNANTVFAEIHDPSRCELRLQLTLRDLALVHLGDRIQVRLPDLPLLELGAEICELAATATRDSQGTPRFQVKARVDAHPELRLGARVRCEFRGATLKQVLAIPRRAVVHDDGHWWCRVRSGETVSRRTVLLGCGDRERVQVLAGLAAGEVVVFKDDRE